MAAAMVPALPFPGFTCFLEALWQPQPGLTQVEWSRAQGSSELSVCGGGTWRLPLQQLSPLHALLAPPAQTFLLTKPDSHYELPARRVILTQRLESSVSSGTQSRGGGQPGQSSVSSTCVRHQPPQPDQPFADIYRQRMPQQWELKGFFSSSL